MPAVNGVGKPCAGEPHARFDGRELETEHRSGQGHGDEGHQGKPCGHSGSETYRRSTSPRQLSTLRATSRLAPIDIGAQFGEDPDVDEVDAHVRRVMQKGLDELAAKRRFPILG